MTMVATWVAIVVAASAGRTNLNANFEGEDRPAERHAVDRSHAGRFGPARLLIRPCEGLRRRHGLFLGA
jgi:hypothetical protein